MRSLIAISLLLSVSGCRASHVQAEEFPAGSSLRFPSEEQADFRVLPGPLFVAVDTAMRHYLGAAYSATPGESPRSPEAAQACSFSRFGLDAWVKAGTAEVGGKPRGLFYIHLLARPSRCESTAVYNDAGMYYIVDEQGQILRRLQPGEPDLYPPPSTAPAPPAPSPPPAPESSDTPGGEDSGSTPQHAPAPAPSPSALQAQISGAHARAIRVATDDLLKRQRALFKRARKARKAAHCLTQLESYDVELREEAERYMVAIRPRERCVADNPHDLGGGTVYELSKDQFKILRRNMEPSPRADKTPVPP